MGAVRLRRWWEGLADQGAEGVVTVIPGLLQLLCLLEAAQQPHQGEEPMRRGRGRGLALVAVVTGPAQFELEPLGVEQRPQRLLETPRPPEDNRQEASGSDALIYLRGRSHKAVT